MAREKGWIQPDGLWDVAFGGMVTASILLAISLIALISFLVILCIACCRGSSDDSDDDDIDQMVPLTKMTGYESFTDDDSEDRPCLDSCIRKLQPCSCCCTLSWFCCIFLFLIVFFFVAIIFIFGRGRNLDYSRAAVREWYAIEQRHYTEDGVAFWWNDEGETSYYTYHWWNVAQLAAVRTVSASTRFYSINRGFTPGLARLGGTTWTGDVSATWEDLARTPGMILNWGLAGAPYVACDIGGFKGATNPKLLTRWYQLGVFMSTMRVHSNLITTPHWPWLWGDDAAAAMKVALDLRYRLIPYHYSLAHAMYSDKVLWTKPMAMVFPSDEACKSMTSQFMDGQLLVAPVVREDSQRSIYLPAGRWYKFNSTDPMLLGPQTVGGVASLDEMPAYVEPGAIIPVAPLVQYTDQLPGGPLEVQVYEGADGKFDLVEDDGTTMSYTSGKTRRVSMSWDDSSKTLSWRVSGDTIAGSMFEHLYVKLFTPLGPSGVKNSESKAIGSSGSISLN